MAPCASRGDEDKVQLDSCVMTAPFRLRAQGAAMKTGVNMTENAKLKRMVRAYMAAHGVNYTTALRAVSRSTDAREAEVSLEALVTGAAEESLTDLLNEPIGAYGLSMPQGLPTLQDPYFESVKPTSNSAVLHPVETFGGGAELVNVILQAQVTLAGDLPTTAAVAAQDAGQVRITRGNLTGPVVSVRSRPVVLTTEVAVLGECVGGQADVQEVFWRSLAL